MYWGYTLQGINISHLGKRKIIFKMPFLGDMLVPWRVTHLLTNPTGHPSIPHHPKSLTANPLGDGRIWRAFAGHLGNGESWLCWTLVSRGAGTLAAKKQTSRCGSHWFVDLKKKIENGGVHAFVCYLVCCLVSDEEEEDDDDDDDDDDDHDDDRYK